ncbi:hypothetical protein GPECTOR_35g883 [Gonium pectorale]|uniref:Uncharacterized protein n=1 Tax=Gonium pectorale TaxID=33097 RepID=A0A150GCZ0_GONPE|nr:hypothetical protein GPECTOR_35g883 [Gonium pectorale]|eukprot:KXZ47445.1 hypothetical protein GPECTOR_35g883 [Gonium pectorale]
MARAVEVVKAEIEEVKADIKRIDGEVGNAEKEEQLRRKEEQLRRKEEQLRTKEEQLRTELQQLRTEALQGVLDARATDMMAQVLKMAKQLPAPGEVLSFEPCLFMDTKYRSVYIRPCYKPLFEELTTSSAKDTIITGTPGIGKSYFFYYLLAELVALPEPPPYILWEHSTAPGEMRCYDHLTGEVRRGNRQSFADQLQDPKAWYISEGIPPTLLSRAHILLIASPSRSRTQEMLKSGAYELFMPLWSLKELLECRAKVYDGSVGEDLAVCLYEHYGGVARYVLGVPSTSTKESAHLDDLLQPLTRALGASNLTQVQSGIGALEVGPEASHRVLHIVTKDDFKLSHLDFASSWVADAVIARATEEDFNRLASLGGSFTVVPIHLNTLARDKALEELSLPDCTVRRFKDVAEISVAGFPEDVYFKPVKTNFPTVDSLLRVGKTLYLFQVTVSSSKTVSARALTDLYKSLGAKVEELELCLYYVVHPDNFESFKLRADTGSSLLDKRQPLAARTHVYILKGDAEARLRQQQTGGSRKRPATSAAAAPTGSHGGGGGC